MERASRSIHPTAATSTDGNGAPLDEAVTDIGIGDDILIVDDWKATIWAPLLPRPSGP